MANKTHSIVSFCLEIVAIFTTANSVVCGICDISERELMNVFAGSTVRVSLNTSYITKEMDIIRWRFKKQDSEFNNLIVEYHFDGKHPPVELEKLKRRAEFSVTDYSLTVSGVVCDDKGTYIVETRNRNDGSIGTIKKSVLDVTVPGTRQTIQAIPGRTVHLSLNGGYIPCSMNTFRWQFSKQGSENYSMVVEYNGELKPVIELQALKGRAIFFKTDYSLVINEIRRIDSGNYKLEARYSTDGRTEGITLISLTVEDMEIPQDSCVSLVITAVSLSLVLGAVATIAMLFTCFWNQNLLQKCSAWTKVLYLFQSLFILYERYIFSIRN
ncbi:uncharacterized protein LOC122815072 [Protopterus annectens]|uniref:uncharacterized protein LOC122815072 n=1 Tax=Protopterus annectens TaxID=7888 RepID=UPI001CFB4A72|nr:uncharacterized protein LOC122815072 [Protopterus annectens]